MCDNMQRLCGSSQEHHPVTDSYQDPTKNSTEQISEGGLLGHYINTRSLHTVRGHLYLTLYTTSTMY